jgi:hypothetical protein
MLSLAGKFSSRPGGAMESIQPNTHSFVVKVWSEETGEASPTVVWRGQITHVPSGEQRSIHELSEIGVFVAPYLEQLGVKPSRWQLLLGRLRLR